MARPRSRVLLVEDEPTVRAAVDRQLEALGWEAVPVGTGREAVGIIRRGLIVDVLLTDLQLPDLDGISVAREIAGFSPGIRVAFMSGAAPARSLEPSDAPFLRKPFSASDLAKALAGAVPLRWSDQPR